MVDHKAIVDAERHEPKGASTATIGTVAKSNGDGTTTWVAPNTLVNTTLSAILEQGSIATQSPSAVDTPLQIEFGAAASGTNFTLSTVGLVTILVAGYYKFTLNLNVARPTGVGIAIIAARVLVNGSQVGQTQGVSLDNVAVNVPLYHKFEGQYAAGTTFQFQIIRDSAGINVGSLTAIDPVLTGWATVPSAWIRIQKVAGAA